MSSAEDREMMERIGRLAGQINRHRNQQAGVGPVRHASSHHHHSGYSSAWRRGGFSHRGGHPAARMPVYRNRTLVLNGGAQQAQSADGETGSPSDSSNSSWVTKTDRHRQLINTNVYKKNAEARTAAIEQTRRQKIALRDKRERAKLVNHLHHMVNSGAFGAANQQVATDKYEIVVQDVRFTVAKNGSKLIKVPGDGNSAKATPKSALIGGVKFYRSKNGNLYRHGVVKAQRYVSWDSVAGPLTPGIFGRQSGTVKKLDVPCKQFSMTGNSIFPNRHPKRFISGRAVVGQRRFTNRATGSCAVPRCRYAHDAHRVAICKDFLQQGECPSGANCDLSHDPTPERTPACLHFARDSCTKPDCKYAHVKVSPAAPVCRDFGFYGYCRKGAECPDRHVFECPNFSNTGVCKIKGCKLAHRERASVLRKSAGLAQHDEEMEDVSSDDDGGSIDEDDVDSDEVDEFIGHDENGGLDFVEQKDFIEL
ncbi:hypothetical protein B0J18DRAFT_443373 [Chaetomium sp. MPI-SDFR-AT-0129]|nr:hypothetical protein B0J18DRAFT_443373 [Chaetomium sp. MPI-SDFR-AT-0129]